MSFKIAFLKLLPYLSGANEYEHMKTDQDKTMHILYLTKCEYKRNLLVLYYIIITLVTICLGIHTIL